MKHWESGYISIDSLWWSLTKTKKEIYLLFLDTQYTPSIYDDIKGDATYTIPIFCHIDENHKKTFDIKNKDEIIPYYDAADLKEKLYTILNDEKSSEKIFIDDVIERQKTTLRDVLESFYREYAEETDKENDSKQNYSYIRSNIIMEYITMLFFDHETQRDDLIKNILAMYSYFYTTDRRQAQLDVYKNNNDISKIFEKHGILKQAALLEEESKKMLSRLKHIYQEIHSLPQKTNTSTLDNLQKDLDHAKEEENYEQAAKIRDEMAKLKNQTQQHQSQDNQPSNEELP